MTPGPVSADFSLEGNTLFVSGSLGVDDARAFFEALRGLLDDTAQGAPRAEMVVDFSGTKYVGSSCIGPLVEAMDRARKGGRSVSIVAKSRVVHLLNLAGVGQLGDIRTAPD